MLFRSDMQKTDIPNFLRGCHNLTKKNSQEENIDIAKSCENSIYITNAEFNSCKLWVVQIQQRRAL